MPEVILGIIYGFAAAFILTFCCGCNPSKT